MNDEAAGSLLRDYLAATTESEAEVCLAAILEDFARPLIRRIVVAVLRGPAISDLDDVVSETTTQLLRRLIDFKTDPEAHAIRDLRAYVATAAYNSCHERLRERYPIRNRLRNHLQYLLNHHASFAMWRTPEGRAACGYRTWIGRRAASSEWLDRLNLQARADPGAQNRSQIASLVEQIFRHAGGPIEPDALVDSIARLIHLEEPRTESVLGTEAGRSLSVESQLELRMTLRTLWNDVRQLPLRQRTALLLGLRDAQGREILSLLPHTRTASMADVAQALDMPLATLAGLWPDLPLDDVRIGEFLGATRQQVIKLRRLGRERLWRSAKRREQQAVTIRDHQNVEAGSPSPSTAIGLTELSRTTTR
jgi:hypothetical protein